MIQISEEKKEQLSEMCEKMLKYGGKMMQCLESLEDDEMGMRDPYEDDEMGERDEMSRGSMGMRMGRREGMRGGQMGQRRGRDSMGRYTRY